jgi:hypothetical protein
MSRVERTENPREEPRKAERGRRDTPQSDPNPGHTATKAEGELDDVEEALRHQRE